MPVQPTGEQGPKELQYDPTSALIKKTHEFNNSNTIGSAIMARVSAVGAAILLPLSAVGHLVVDLVKLPVSAVTHIVNAVRDTKGMERADPNKHFHIYTVLKHALKVALFVFTTPALPLFILGAIIAPQMFVKELGKFFFVDLQDPDDAIPESEIPYTPLDDPDEAIEKPETPFTPTAKTSLDDSDDVIATNSIQTNATQTTKLVEKKEVYRPHNAFTNHNENCWYHSACRLLAPNDRLALNVSPEKNNEVYERFCNDTKNSISGTTNEIIPNVKALRQKLVGKHIPVLEMQKRINTLHKTAGNESEIATLRAEITKIRQANANIINPIFGDDNKRAKIFGHLMALYQEALVEKNEDKIFEVSELIYQIYQTLQFEDFDPSGEPSRFLIDLLSWLQPDCIQIDAEIYGTMGNENILLEQTSSSFSCIRRTLLKPVHDQQNNIADKPDLSQQPDLTERLNDLTSEDATINYEIPTTTSYKVRLPLIIHAFFNRQFQAQDSSGNIKSDTKGNIVTEFIPNPLKVPQNLRITMKSSDLDSNDQAIDAEYEIIGATIYGSNTDTFKHYTALVKGEDDQWYYCDDLGSRVEELTQEAVIKLMERACDFVLRKVDNKSSKDASPEVLPVDGSGVDPSPLDINE